LRRFAISLQTNCAKSGCGSIGAGRHGSAETLLVRAIAYRIQELHYGGLSKATRRKLTALVQARGSDVETATGSGAKWIRAGARLVREWNGRTHMVTVEEEGFLYAGRSYRSLSAIAREITGARWSGPRFFGLASKRGASGA
jgi:DUF2924 family protein